MTGPATTGLHGEQRPSRFNAMWRAVSDWVRGESASGISCGADEEIERIARDVGMTSSELRATVKQGNAAADLLLERLAALDLDPAEVAEVGPETFRDLQRVCALCESKRRCARDLGHDAAAPQWKDYCPNAQTLIALDALPWACRREW